MNATYPNLELLEYKVRHMLYQQEPIRSVAETYCRENKTKYLPLAFSATMFPQIWGSTCAGIDLMEDGSPAWGCDSMTLAYTTVFHEENTDIYVVCFGEEACYFVIEPNENFINDFKNHNMASMSEAKKKY